jgi:hypothetical protein
MLKLLTTVVFVGMLAAAAPALQSTPLARELAQSLAAQHLDAIAAQDPDDPERFIAALLAPGQLLVVSKRHVSPAAIQERLTQRQYRDVYLDLQASPAIDGSWFLQDMEADGLRAGRDQSADVLYAGDSAPAVFDGDWKTRTGSEKEYDEQLAAADARYARLLEVLLRQLHGASRRG